MIRLTSYGGKQRGPEEPLHEGKEESEKAGLKFSIQKTKIQGSAPITSWQIDVETMTDFIFLGSKVTVVTVARKLKDACSLEEKL